MDQFEQWLPGYDSSSTGNNPNNLQMGYVKLKAFTYLFIAHPQQGRERSTG